MTLSQAFLEDLSDETEKTRALLGAVPAGRGDWKPHEKSMSLAQLAGHIAETPSWSISMVEDDFDFEGMMKDYQPFVSAEPGELLAALDTNVAGARAAFEGRDDAFLRADWTMRKGEQVLMKSPRHKVMRSFLLRHWAHHRGQLTVYLRMLGVAVPATYGSTADVEMF